jgi:hypothetical protein
MQRYHPRTNRCNLQGNTSKTTNQWALAPSLTSALHACFDTSCELFASPLNTSMNTNVKYCTTLQEDAILGVLYAAFSYRWICSCLANSEYEPVDMRNTILHALACTTSSLNPFIVVLILPAWEDSPRRTRSILQHPNLTTLAHFPANHLTLITTHKQLYKKLKLSIRRPADWPVDLIIVANEEG